MSQFDNAIAVVPRPAKVLALAIMVGFPLILYLCVPIDDPELNDLPPWARSMLFAGVGVIVGIMVMLFGYVHGDAKRRGMRPVLWVLLAIFVPNLIGVVLYFILRDPILVPCHSCGETVEPGYAFCPCCATPVKPACPSCQKPVETEWANCAFCGANLKPK